MIKRMMRSKRKRYALIGTLVGFCIIGLLVALSWHKTNKLNEGQAEAEFSAWLVDWRWQEGLNDLEQMTDHLKSLQVFALYYDEADQLMWTNQMNTALPHIMETVSEHNDIELYLTIVNDQFRSDGTVSHKDPALITRLMATEESRNEHIEHIVEAMIQHSFDGVEIDYERIAEDDWEHVSAFYAQLYERLDSIGKSLRVVLEPRTPIDTITLPVGPIYVMMAYNLYGTHSGPGPKADDALITTLAAKMKQLPQANSKSRSHSKSSSHYIALATGGFAWAWADTDTDVGIDSGGKQQARDSFSHVIQLTEHEAAALMEQSIEPPRRDTASGSITFDYVNDAGVWHTAWYADDITLARWAETARRSGYPNIAFWRLGEWSDASLQLIQR